MNVKVSWTNRLESEFGAIANVHREGDIVVLTSLDGGVTRELSWAKIDYLSYVAEQPSSVSTAVD